MPCMLIVYVAQSDVAYWLYLQAYFENWEGFDLSQVGETVTVHLPKANRVDREAIKQFARYRGKAFSSPAQMPHYSQQCARCR